MRESRQDNFIGQHSKVDLVIVVWLSVLSFWSGVSYYQIQSNKEMIEDNRLTRVRIWSDIKEMQQNLAEIVGYIKAIEHSKRAENNR